VPGPDAPDRALSVGEAARLLQVTGRTVMKWVDRGHLAGYWLPATRDDQKRRERRVPLKSLWAFCAARGVPTDRLPLAVRRVLAVALAPAELAPLARLAARGGWELASHPNWVTAGFAGDGRPPWAVVFAQAADARVALGTLRARRPDLVAVYVRPEDARADPDLAVAADFRRPFDPARLVHFLEGLV
jgi:excisionase family DNA binding protein